MKALMQHLKKRAKDFVAVHYDGDRFRMVSSYTAVAFTPMPKDRPTIEKFLVELRAGLKVYIKTDSYVSVGRELPPENMDAFFASKVAELDTAEKAVLTEQLIDARHRKDVDGNPQIWKIVTTETRQTAIPLAQYDIIPEVLGMDAEVYLTNGDVPTVVARGKTKQDDMVVIAVKGER